MAERAALGPQLGQAEISFLAEVLKGSGVDAAMAEFGLSKSVAEAALAKSTDYLELQAKMLQDRSPIQHGVTESDGAANMIYISPIAFLRSMISILWSALRYPCHTTEIDLSTGRVIRHR